MESSVYHSIPRIKLADSQNKWRPANSKSRIAKVNIGEDIIGSSSGFLGPCGWTRYTYLDHSASGKALKCIENFIQEEVLPHYANTHTTISYTSLQMSCMRNEARKIIRQSVGATENDEVIFCGAGATTAVHKLLHCISHPKSRKLVAVVGPFEHHSNLLPWREAAEKVIQVPVNSVTGHIDIAYLRTRLRKLSKWPNKNQLIVGCFSAGSNLTGEVTDDVEITQIMHEYGGLAFWDYAAAAPHVDINMNPGERGNKKGFKDAIFFSGHKFLGGPQTPGVLVVKRQILQNPVPHNMGGGTVLFTTRQSHHYLDEITEREEGGTPDIVGSIRLGLVFRVRNIIGIQKIVKKEADLCRVALQAWSSIPEIRILGSSSMTPRLPIIAFMIKHPQTGYYLHHNFVVALLNDFFGIQCRGGCMCAGPYAQVLLAIDDKLAGLYTKHLEKTHANPPSDGSKYGSILKPGFVRISFSFHTSYEEFQFVIDAVKLVARIGWKLLSHYRISWDTATFAFTGSLKIEATSLASFDSFFKTQQLKNNPFVKNNMAGFSYSKCIESVEKLAESTSGSIFDSSLLLEQIGKYRYFKARKLRWFMLPLESALLLHTEYEYIVQRDARTEEAFQVVFIQLGTAATAVTTQVTAIAQLTLKEERRFGRKHVENCSKIDFSQIA